MMRAVSNKEGEAVGEDANRKRTMAVSTRGKGCEVKALGFGYKGCPRWLGRGQQRVVIKSVFNLN